MLSFYKILTKYRSNARHIRNVTQLQKLTSAAQDVNEKLQKIVEAMAKNRPCPFTPKEVDLIVRQTQKFLDKAAAFPSKRR